MIKMAMAAGKYEEALKAQQWLLDHVPADEDGGRILTQSSDKGSSEQGHQGPIIQIGFNVGQGGIPRTLPGVVVSDEEG